MENTKVLKIDPIFKDLKNLPPDDNCWVVIDVSSEHGAKVSYINPNSVEENGDPFSNDSEGFKYFAEYIIGENFKYGDENSSQISISDKIATASGATGSIEEDFDEDSKKTFNISVGNAQIIEIHNGIELSKIPQIIKSNLKEIESLEREAANDASDSDSLRKDPYKYYGVSRSDFF